MTPDLPAPLSSADCDLRGYDFMPLYGHRLFHSDLYEETSPEEFKVAVKLWWEAWQQCPAGSLPNSDSKLRRLADLGNDTKTWTRVKDAVLRGFVLCNDGRLYHRLLCVWAGEAYAKRVAERERKRRYRERHSDGDGGGSPSHGDGDSGRNGHGHTAQGTYRTADCHVPATRKKVQGQDRTGQESKEERKDISFSSFSGSLAREVSDLETVDPEAVQGVVLAMAKAKSSTAKWAPGAYQPLDRQDQLDAMDRLPPRRDVTLKGDALIAARKRQA